MIRKLFNKITSTKEPQPLTSPLKETQQAIHQLISDPARIRTVDIPQGQHAALYQANHGAKLYPAGSHPLAEDTLKRDEPLHAVFLRSGGACKGRWSLNHQDHEHIPLALSGEYTLLIESPQRLAQACISMDTFNDDGDFGQWLADSIAHILKTQRIPARDINAENERFAGFLRDALTLSLRPRGLALKDLSLDIHSVDKHANAPRQTTASEVSAAQQPTAQEKQPQQETDPTKASTTEAAENVTHLVIARGKQPEKLYYYVRNGVQLGPFARDDIQQKIQQGDIRKHDLLWQKGMTSWKQAADFNDFHWST